MSGDNGVSVSTSAMRVENLRAALELGRHRSANALEALGKELEEQADWTTRYRARPLPFLAAAFFIGFLLARR
jgi:hypothetical protein